MSTLEKIAFFQNRRDEVPNQVLAKELAETKNAGGIREIAANLVNKNKNVRSDCLKVLYEIGYLDPDLISGYWSDFLTLLKSKDNRMVWGGLIGLATIADRHPTKFGSKLTTSSTPQPPARSFRRFGGSGRWPGWQKLT